MNTNLILKIGKERNMTFPKDEMEKLKVSAEDLAGGMIVCQVEKLVLGDGRVIEEDELDRLLKRKE